MKAILFLFLFGASSLLAEVSIKAGNFKFIPTAPWVVQEPGSHMVKGALTHTAKGPLVKIYHFGEGRAEESKRTSNAGKSNSTVKSK